MTQFLNTMCWLAFVTVFVVAGCEGRYKEEPVALNPLVDPNFVVPDYAWRAVEATGGRWAWLKAEKLHVDCVVTFYKPDGTFYLTEHHYEIHPWLNSIRILAQEAPDKFVWLFSPDGFSVLEGADRVNVLPVKMVSERPFAEAILNITTAPVRFLDKSVEFSRVSRPVKRQGRWYYPIGRASYGEIGIEPYWSEVVFYQSMDNSLVDVLWFADVDRKKFLAVHGYEYKEVKKGAVLVPTKIEIFETDADGDLRERLVKIDFK